MILGAAKQDRAAASTAGTNRVFYEILEYFRDTNAEGLRIRKRLEGVLEQPPPCNQAALAQTVADTAESLHHEIAEARQRAAAIDRWRDADAETVAYYARELTQVSGAWDDLEQDWKPVTPNNLSEAELLRIAKASIATLDQMIFVCACQTIPNELDAYLKNYRIGTCLDFLTTFRNQLTSDEATRAVLVWLAPQSVVISGLVDLKHAQVIKADRRVWRQWLSVAIVAVTVLLGFELIVLSPHVGGWLGFPPNAWPVQGGERHSLSSAYVLVLIGVLGHWILDRVKLNRSGDDITPFSEWLIWIHVNEVPIVTRIATVWLTIALGLGLGVYKLTPQIQPVTWFTAGYFLDSTFDALLGRFNTFISSKDPAKIKDKS